MLEHIRREVVLDGDGLPLLSTDGQTVTIEKYSHIKYWGLFDEEPPARPKKANVTPEMEYKVDPVTGLPVPIGHTNPMDEDDKIFGSLSIDPGMSDKS